MAYLYFISNERRSVVKIGIANNPKKRLKTFQTAHYEELIILKVIKIDNRQKAFQLETSLHKKFVKYHIRGEWFKLTPTVKKFIEMYGEDEISITDSWIVYLSGIIILLSMVLLFMFVGSGRYFII